MIASDWSPMTHPRRPFLTRPDNALNPALARSPVPGPCSNLDSSTFFAELWREERWKKEIVNPQKDVFDAAWGGEVYVLKSLLAQGVPTSWRDQVTTTANQTDAQHPPRNCQIVPSHRAKIPRLCSALTHPALHLSTAHYRGWPICTPVGLDGAAPCILRGPARVRADAASEEGGRQRQKQ